MNSFASVSINPLLILWSIDHRVSSLDAFVNGEKFAVHILSGDQKQLCNLFSTKRADRFSMSKWEYSNLQLPILDGAYAVLECQTTKK
ncbi:flavin reductase family protein [Oceanobacillus damuensis]|uniref:flavin reductase family protein n=1 Tax=Oceanobacillus damuensis TaxID=937928 RepID=UPI002D219C7B|nr:flavin reductase family protein [Oceanobacillus damuensis]